ncbi:MAG: hypothetical protein RMM16_12310, partial [Chloroherpetonaceae bacterium]|nr:hypothetical protein [Chloroherpetonaceae bacterium]
AQIPSILRASSSSSKLASFSRSRCGFPRLWVLKGEALVVERRYIKTLSLNLFSNCKIARKPLARFVDLIFEKTRQRFFVLAHSNFDFLNLFRTELRNSHRLA